MRERTMHVFLMSVRLLTWSLRRGCQSEESRSACLISVRMSCVSFPKRADLRDFSSTLAAGGPKLVPSFDGACWRFGMDCTVCTGGISISERASSVNCCGVVGIDMVSGMMTFGGQTLNAGG